MEMHFHIKKDFEYVCQNNNNNNQIVNVDITNEEQFTPTITACNTIYTAEGDIRIVLILLILRQPLYVLKILLSKF